MAWFLLATATGCGAGDDRDAQMPTTSSASGVSASDTSASDSGEDETGPSMKLDAASMGADLGGGGVVGGCDDVDQLPSNQGCEFWAVDLPNVSVVPPLTIDTVPADQQFAVVVTNPSAKVTANVEIFGADPGPPVASGLVPFDTMRVFELPALNITPGATTANGQAYRITADVPITAYQFQPLDNTSPVYSNDATLLFPTNVLTGDYLAITGDANLVAADGFSTSDVNTGAFVSVVATAADTTITLYPTAGLFPGAYQDVTLQAGQVLTAISSDRGAPGWGNLSGTRVIADKPVAVFSGSVATSEPTGTTACCADHLEHQMLPLTAWGSRYAAAPAASATGNGNDASLFRITGAFDGTQLTYSPAAPAGAPTTLDAGVTVAFTTELPFTVASADDAQSFAVAQFLLSNQYFGGLSRPGDPTMILLPAPAQFQDRYVFLMPQGYGSNFVTIIRPAGSAVALDDTMIADAVFQPLGTLDAIGFEYAHVSAAPGSHTLQGDDPFGIIVSGHANDVSYGYAGGSGVGVISEPPPPPAG
jgi:hypothetical protein